MTRVALYARYSSDNQRDASIEDQLRQCRDRAEREGWTVVETYSDRAISGASMVRSGVQSLLADAQGQRFDIVLSEALDRISRDQEDVAGMFKRLRFAGVGIVTLSEGEISELHVGLKGTMNALFLKDLAMKTHRGLRGRVEKEGQGGQRDRLWLPGGEAIRRSGRADPGGPRDHSRSRPTSLPASPKSPPAPPTSIRTSLPTTGGASSDSPTCSTIRTAASRQPKPCARSSTRSC
jgi:DNA invertase Pin-like site-specific DNA recombinase